MQLANIKRTNIGTGGSVVGAGGGSAGGVAASVPSGVQRSNESEERSAVQIIVNGNMFAAQETVQWLVDKIGDAINNRDMVFINQNSRQAMELARA
jgi:uncharacterized protein YycO